MSRVSLFLLLLLALPTLSWAGEVPKHVATTPVPQTEYAADWLETHAECNLQNEQKHSPLVFLGDSLMQMWQKDDNGKPSWNTYWAPLKALNYGIAGDRTEHVLWRLDHGALDGLQPKLVVLCIGTNNAGQQFEGTDYRCTPQQTADGIRAILQRIRAKCPGSKILLLAILPRGEVESDPARKLNEATNALIKDAADGKQTFFLDIGTKFLKPNRDGDVTIQPDLLHLSAKGYQIWAEAIAPTVKELLAKPLGR